MQPLKILILEDNEFDAELSISVLKEDGLEFTWTRVDNKNDFIAHLNPSVDLILADFTLPQFSAEEAFNIFKVKELNIPFILVSGTLPDEKGVLLMKQGVDDFILKDQIVRLSESVRHALAHKQAVLDKREAEEALKVSEERFHNAFNFAPNGMALISSDKIFREVNEALCEMLSETCESLLNKTLIQVCARDDRKRVEELLQKLESDPSQQEQVEVQMVCSDDSTIWALLSISILANHSHQDFICQIHDITQRKDMETQLEHLANYCVLTGLPNMNLLEKDLKQLILGASIVQKRVGVFLLSIDQLKLIDETFWSFLTNELLKLVAQRLDHDIKKKNILASLTRGVFAMAWTLEGDDEQVSEIVKKVKNIFQKPFTIEGNEYFLSTSIGIAFCPDHADQEMKLISCADIAMHHAQAKGSESTVTFNKVMFEHVRERFHLQTNINKGIQEKEFTVVYQPVYNSQTLNICSVEALLRWKSKQLGVVAPSKFIPIAEESDQINRLGKFVLEEVCRFASEISPEIEQDIIYSVNVSVRQLRNSSFIDDLVEIAKQAHFPPQRLMLEITERQLMEDVNEITDTILKLQDLNVSIAIDDFGIAYSCFEYLARFRADRLKIDGSFIKNIHVNDKNQAIVSSMIAMSQKLNITCVGEGVEQQAELDYLKAIKCDEIQGFLLSKPIEAMDLKNLLTEKK